MSNIVHQQENTQLARVQPALDFTPQQRQMIRDSYANGASEQEFAVLMEIAKARRLNPLLKQIHFVSRENNTKDERGNWSKKKVWTAQVSIDGMRAIAQRTGLYDGQDEPEFDDDITKCVVRVYRKDWARPSVGVAYWSEYVQTTRDGEPTKFWKTMPRVMLSKCAESIALRKAFPEDMSGLYTPEEMQQGEVVQEQAVHDAVLVEAPHQPEPAGIVDSNIVERIREAAAEDLDALRVECTALPHGPLRKAAADAYAARRAELATRAA